MQDGIGNYSNASTEIEALQQQGLHFQKQGAHGSAVAVYQRLLALGQDGPAIRYNLGSALLHLQNPTEALEQFEAGIQLCPQESGLRLGLANAHKLLGNPTAAEAALEQELDLCPESIPAAINLGWLLEEQNRVPEALVQYRKAMYYQPNHPVLRWNHGLACLMLGDYSRGWRDYEHRWAARQKN
jgi:tetratricopeptide (TPR) repeat protein